MIDGIQPRQPRQKKNEPVEPVDEPAFVPPELVVEQEEAPVNTEEETPSWKQANVKTGKKRFGFIKIPDLSKKQWIIVAIVSFLLVGGGVSALILTHKKPAPKAKPAPVVQKKVEPPKPTTVGSKLSGLQVQPEVNNNPVLGIMVENSPDARPQAGLNQADVVFEAIAEGGITRFLTLWLDNHPDYVGPVRSVRLYYLQWLQGFDAPIAHVGGAPEALSYIKAGNGIKDLDQFYNTDPYRRVSNRYAPHNMYTDTNKLLSLAKSKGWTASDFNGFVRKGKEEPSTAPNAKNINIVISGPLYNVHYDYDTATNSYKRSEGGQPHMDERSQQQLSPKVVIAMVVPYNVEADGIHSSYQLIGSGKAYVFQDGIVTEGIWEKTDAKSQVRFGDTKGSPLALNPGQTWITVVGAASNVSYQP